ncbi:MAG: protein kinase [Candidatus Sulfotelmatobacter sp.]
MALTSGSKLGPYEVVAPIGAGGMGEVYRARDGALGRDVAVKVLPASFSEDGDRLRRFKQEAQAAAALNHPNILTIYHVGEHSGSPYIVSELLEGESLRQRLQAGPLPVRKAIDCGVQVARGLAAAHDKGILHRDLKPENIFLTKDGRVKILDFGLAKLTRPEEGGSGPDSLTLTGQSEPGFVLGTVGYMSPEQVRGQVAGPGSDLFSFGAVLYEMLTGKRAFRGETAADTMSAILKEDPQELSEAQRQIPPALERIVRHCLEKNPEERFQSARDVAFDLEALSAASGTAPVSPRFVSAQKPGLLRVLAVAAAILAIVAVAVWFAMRRGTAPLPTYHRLTFRQGTVQAARFAPDGQSIVYSASWDGNPPEIYTTRPQGPESRPRGLSGSTLLAVSPTGEIAVQLGAHAIMPTFSVGTLARTPLEGGAPREILPNVEGAEWAPDSTTLLITRQSAGSDRLEFPPGKLIYETAGAISQQRFSPRADRIAFFDHSGHMSDDGSVAVVDLAGHKTVLSTGWEDLTGLAWSPRGDEIWFTGSRDYASSGLFAVTLKGSERKVADVPGDLRLFDIARDGRVLLGHEDWRGVIYGLAPGESRERDLSWFDFSVASDLSADGKTLLLYEAGEAGGAGTPTYLRSTDGSPAVRLSDGTCAALSHDGQRVICFTPEGQLIEVPTKSGEVKPLTHDQLIHGWAQWFPDESRILFHGKEPAHGQRAYVQDLATGQPRAITPEGASSYFRLSPDGAQLAVAMGADYRTVVYPVSGGEPRPVVGLEPGEVPVAWSSDSRFLYCYRLGDLPVNIFRVELANGGRTPWKQLEPTDPIGITFVGNILVSSDMKSYVYTVQRRLDVLYLVEGLH